jgi:hypothetical protein
MKKILERALALKLEIRGTILHEHGHVDRCPRPRGRARAAREHGPPRTRQHLAASTLAPPLPTPVSAQSGCYVDRRVDERDFCADPKKL